MATYEPPTEDLTYPDGFNPLAFQQLTDALTIEEGDARYLRFPLGQGAETIPTLTVGGTLTTVDIEPSSASTALDIAGTQVSGALTIGNESARTGAIQIGTGTGGTGKTITINGLASANTTTINGGIINISGSGGQTTSISNTGILSLQNGSSSAMNIGTNKNGGTIDIGHIGATSTTTTINIATGTAYTGAISIGTGDSNKAITIGGASSTGESTTIRGKTVAINATATDGTLNLGQTMTGSTASIVIGGATTTATPITIGNGSNQTGAISIGTGASAGKSITVGNVSGNYGTLNLGCASISIADAANTTALKLGTGMTSGTITIGGSGTNALSISRPITTSGDPAATTTAIGYILTNVSSSSGAIAVPVNTYTWSSGLMTLSTGVYMLSLEARLDLGANPTSAVYNLGFMNSAPITGDSATASSAPANTISGINGNYRNADPTTYSTGTYVFNVGGVVVNNYAGTYNSIYGIFNAYWTAGTFLMTSLTIRAVRIA
tara:strand:+ start:102 stop:1592 length:1491 start_codon:yes stop_codon:yes gene_type:complete